MSAFSRHATKASLEVAAPMWKDPQKVLATTGCSDGCFMPAQNLGRAGKVNGTY